jgi:hypothetical protein
VARSQADHHGEASAWINTGSRLLQLDRTEEALSAAHRARELYEAFGDEEDIALAERLIAAILDAHP